MLYRYIDIYSINVSLSKLFEQTFMKLLANEVGKLSIALKRVRLDLGCRNTSEYYFNIRRTTKAKQVNYILLESSFHTLFKNTTYRHLGGIGKTLSYTIYIYILYKSAKFGLVSYCHYISLTLLNSDPVE